MEQRGGGGEEEEENNERDGGNETVTHGYARLFITNSTEVTLIFRHVVGLNIPSQLHDLGNNPDMGTTKKEWTREEIAVRILAGESLIVYNNQLLRIPQAWLNAHPGGSLAILHFLGRDASDEIDAYHCDQTMVKIKSYVVGTVETSAGIWEPLVPPIMTGWVRKLSSDGKQAWYNEAAPIPSENFSEILLVEHDSRLLQTQGPTLSNLIPPPATLSSKDQARHSAAYKALHKRIIHAGLYETRYITGYGPEIARYLLLAASSAVAYSHDWLIISAVCLGLLWHQLVFTVHDLGHMGVTHDWTKDRIIAIILADFIGGLSVGWWVDVSSRASRHVHLLNS